jgi:hypothetical protein
MQVLVLDALLDYAAISSSFRLAAGAPGEHAFPSLEFKRNLPFQRGFRTTEGQPLSLFKLAV